MAHREHRRALGGNLRTYRERAGLTQEKLAEKAELSPKFLGEVERGTVNVSVDVLARLAHALKIPVNDLTRGF